jgi:nitrate reductase gamma subunit
MKSITTALLVLASITLSGIAAEGSWLVDARRFHISAHGRSSCQDCHGDVVEQGLHPDPADVNKKLADFFNMGECLSCHDDITDDLGQGLHGSIRVKDPKGYVHCLRCHNPHYQPWLGRGGVAECGACHEHRLSLPALCPEDEVCMRCHRSVDEEDPQGRERLAGFCFHCHGQTGTKAQRMTGKAVPLIDQRQYQSSPHAGIGCRTCHPQSAQFNHRGQGTRDCHQCHLPHDEKVSHDAHAGVACEACHLKGIKPIRDPESKLVLWKSGPKARETSMIHQMLREDGETLCQRCHFKGNQVGAVSMILPAKSVLCMPCHAATFSVGDTTTILALIVFFVGLIMAASVWLSGSLSDERDLGPFGKAFKLLWNGVKCFFSRKIFLLIKAMILDVLFQRRLYRQSGTRWFIHSLIFFPFVFRFFWGLVALTSSIWKPEWSWVWAMLDKNNATTGFLFDVTGSMIILGVVMAFIRGGLRRSSQLPGLPRQDRVALGLIAGIIAVGFVLEGMRISMTGTPGGAEYSFLGYGLSILLSEAKGLTGLYGYLWYIHAILTGAFFAYLPFSRLLHIILAPVILAMNAVYEHEHSRK